MSRPPDHMTRRQLAPEHSDLDQWPKPSTASLTEAEKVQYLKNREAINDYLLNRRTLTEIERRLGIHRQQIFRLTARCVRVNPQTGTIFGYCALIPHVRTLRYTRVAALPTFREIGSARPAPGYAGAFGLFMKENPSIQAEVDKVLLQWNEKNHTKFSHQELYTKFVEICERQGLPIGVYPLIELDWSAVHGLKDYADRFLSARPSLAALLKGGLRARARSKAGTGHGSMLDVLDCYDTVEGDEFQVSCAGAVRIEVRGVTQMFPLRAVCVVVLICRASRAALGYAVSLTGKPKTIDIVTAIAFALNPPTRHFARLPFGLRYLPSGGFPAEVIPALRGTPWSLMLLDNDSTHYGGLLTNDARKKLGFGMIFGPIARFEKRPYVENIIGILEKNGFKRFPTNREPAGQWKQGHNPDEQARALQIDYTDLLAVIDVTLANYNGSRNEGVVFLTPLQRLEQWVEAST